MSEILRHIVVCIKQVPDVAEMKLDPVTNTIVRQGVASVMNPDDAMALEAALDYKDRYGARVTALSMGPVSATDVLQKAISQGADDAVLVNDKRFAGSDTLATSRILAAAIRRLARELSVDFILCGYQAVDGDTAQVGPGIAARLGYALASRVDRIVRCEDDVPGLVVTRQFEGRQQTALVPLPCVLTVLPGQYNTRYSSLRHVIRAAQFSVSIWGLDDLGLDPSSIGVAGSPTRVSKVQGASLPSRKGQAIRASDPGAIRQISSYLQRQVQKLRGTGKGGGAVED